MVRPFQVIVFDLGNVLVHFDHTIGCRRVAQLTGLDPDRVHQILFKGPLQIEYETGRIDGEEVAARFNAAAGSDLEERVLIAAISDVFWPNPQIIPTVVQLGLAGYRLGILSNTCAGHWRFIRRRFPWVDRLFSFHLFSFEEGVMKPAADIYSRLVDRAGCLADRILFLDDRMENVMAARECGLKAVQYQTALALNRWLDANGVWMNE